MSRRWVVCAFVAAIALSAIDLDACGDKFLRIGRSARFRGYAAIHPASILIYKPANATAAGIRDLEAFLKQAGHRPSVAEHGTDIARTGHAAFDVVIAAYGDATKLRDELRSVPTRPEVLPILYKPSKALAAEAHRQFHHLLLPHAMTNIQALEEIDELMERRQDGAAATASAR